MTGVHATRHGENFQFTAPIVIDATGVNSAIAVNAGAGNQDSQRCAVAIRGYYENIAGLQNTVEFYFDESILPGYYWSFPTSPTTANIGCGTFQHIIDERKLDLRNQMDGFFKNHPIVKEKLKNATLCGKLSGGKIPLAIEYQNSRVRDGLILTGDAGSFTDPVTAEGISYAMTSGILAAETAVEAINKNNYSAQQLSAYDNLWKTRFNRQFSKAPFLTSLLSADIFADYLSKSFRENDRALRSIGKLALQYELMFKLKALMKAI
ncbi:NAD(P)/FAD-dependent oxidoreductase [bacterium]|nr:NAD(P)/FAD-dependent oxidoreductase [bacterium]